MRADTIFSDLKMLKHLDQFHKIVDGNLVSPPITTEIDLTNRCNHKCFWCIDSEIRKDGAQLNKDIIIETLVNLRKMGCNHVVFKGGGEPLIHPDIKEILEMSGNYEMFHIGIVTNGSMKPDLAEIIADKVTFIRFSIDSATPETHKKIHDANNFDIILENLRNVVKYRNEFGSKLQIGINYVVWKQNIHEISEASKLYKSIGADYIHFKMAIMPNDSLNYKEIDLIEKQIKKAKSEANVTFMVNTKEIEGYYLIRRKGALLERGKSWKHCIAPHLVSIITADGSVYPCCFLKEEKESILGNIKDKAFHLIHESDHRKDIIRNYINKGFCRVHCKGRTSNFRYDHQNRIYNYVMLQNKMDEGFM